MNKINNCFRKDLTIEDLDINKCWEKFVNYVESNSEEHKFTHILFDDEVHEISYLKEMNDSMFHNIYDNEFYPAIYLFRLAKNETKYEKVVNKKTTLVMSVVTMYFYTFDDDMLEEDENLKPYWSMNLSPYIYTLFQKLDDYQPYVTFNYQPGEYQQFFNIIPDKIYDRLTTEHEYADFHILLEKIKSKIDLF